MSLAYCNIHNITPPHNEPQDYIKLWHLLPDCRPPSPRYFFWPTVQRLAFYVRQWMWGWSSSGSPTRGPTTRHWGCDQHTNETGPHTPQYQGLAIISTTINLTVSMLFAKNTRLRFFIYFLIFSIHWNIYKSSKLYSKERENYHKSKIMSTCRCDATINFAC